MPKNYHNISYAISILTIFNSYFSFYLLTKDLTASCLPVQPTTSTICHRQLALSVLLVLWQPLCAPYLLWLKAQPWIDPGPIHVQHNHAVLLGLLFQGGTRLPFPPLSSRPSARATVTPVFHVSAYLRCANGRIFLPRCLSWELDEDSTFCKYNWLMLRVIILIASSVGSDRVVRTSLGLKEYWSYQVTWDGLLCLRIQFLFMCWQFPVFLTGE